MTSATNPRAADHRQYHIGVRPGDVAPSILLVGDPRRAERIADEFLDEHGTAFCEREFVTFTGRYQGLALSVMGTGMSAANTEIAVIELSQCFDDPSQIAMVRAGSCGALREEIAVGDLIVTRAAYRIEDTSTWFTGLGYPASAHPEAVMALLWAASDLGVAHHLGITATAPGFYGAQGREIEGFPVREPHIQDRLAREGVSNLEMETATLLTLASLRGFRAGAVCAAYANRPRDTFIAEADKHAAEARCVRVGLDALVRMDRFARARSGAGACWHPGLAALDDA
ncbi:nucleoside phosphorylase [Nannocystaceae bacterium ST9]